jgi:hypothetical protein
VCQIEDRFDVSFPFQMGLNPHTDYQVLQKAGILDIEKLVGRPDDLALASDQAHTWSVLSEVVKFLGIEAGKFLCVQARAEELRRTGGRLSRIIPSRKRQNQDWLTERWLCVNN